MFTKSILDDDRNYLEGSPTQFIEITKQQIQDVYRAQTGNRSPRREATIAWIKAQLINTFGSSILSENGLDIDFDDLTDGRPTKFEITFGV